MSAIIQDLRKHDNTIVYPTTVVQAVYMPDQKTTIYDELEAMRDESYTISYPDASTIKKTYTESGITVTFNILNNGYKMVCKKANNTLYWTKTVTFGTNGAVTVDTTYNE